MYEEVDIPAEQSAAIYQNRASLPSLFSLGRKLDAYNVEQLLTNLEKMLPGYAGLRDKGTAILEGQLRGEIPDDVAREIQRITAERSRAGGYAGSEVAHNLTARDLGLTSLEITNRALDSASRWMQQARQSTPTFDVASMFVTPAQRIGVKLHENQMKFQRNWMQAQIDALPEPWEAAVGEIFDSIEEMGSSVLSAYAGGAMGGGGGAAMGGGGGGNSGDIKGGFGGGEGVNTSSKIGAGGYKPSYL